MHLGRTRRGLRSLALGLALCLGAPAGLGACERGDASRTSCDPADPATCPAGWACRAGVCLRYTTPVEMPVDPVPPAPPPPADAGPADAADDGGPDDGGAPDGG